MAVDVDIVDAVLDVLHSRKGFDWWWDEIGSANHAEIKEKARAKVRTVLKEAPDV